MLVFFLFKEKCLVDQLFEDFECAHIWLTFGEAIGGIFDMNWNLGEAQMFWSKCANNLILITKSVWCDTKFTYDITMIHSISCRYICQSDAIEYKGDYSTSSENDFPQ